MPVSLIELREVLDTMRRVSMSLFGHEHFGQSARDLVLLMALAGGDLTPHKASEVCGIPRGTVARRLASLEAVGLVQRRPGGAYALTVEAHGRAAKAVRASQRGLGHAVER